MTPERWQRIKDVLEAIDSASAADRATTLDRLCHGDSELRRDVEPFLSDAGAGTFIHGVIGQQAASLSETTASAARQERFGHYQLVRRIGQGGMGAVFEAVRVDDFHKKVALKIIKQGLDSDFARTRFLQERQMLASLEHPYIARLLDGGESDDGSPYLVLEFVDGEPITIYCAKLDRTARLRLFLNVCEAVEHAHRNLVVHRDLKPANILVTSNGEPKLLDFGIAKLLDPGSSHTQTGFMALTPDYASPEQVRGQPITTASDVYSLGVILYQLLTDRKPYNLDTATALEMDRVICVQPPPPPGLGDELDHILMMALRKEPERRYGGVQRFAEDIERYLDHRPVSAKPDTWSYRASKFLQRNRWGLAAAAAIVISLAAGLVIAERQAMRAERSFAEARKLANTFLLEFDPKLRNLNGATEARELLVKTVLQYLDNLSHEGSSDPGLKFELARAYDAVGMIQGMPAIPNLGRPRDAIRSFERSLELHREALAGSDDPEKLRVYSMTHSHLGRLADVEGDIKKAQENFEKGLAIAGRIPSPKGNETSRLRAQMNLYSYFADFKGHIGQPAEALELLRKSLYATKQQLMLKPSDLSYTRDVALVIDRIGEAERQLGLLEASRASLIEAEAMARGLVTKAPENIGFLHTLTGVLFHQCTLYFGLEQKNLGERKAAISACGENVQLLVEIAEKDKKNIGFHEDVVGALIRLAEVKTGMDNQGAWADLAEAQKRLALLPGTYTHVEADRQAWNRAKARLEGARRNPL